MRSLLALFFILAACSDAPLSPDAGMCSDESTPMRLSCTGLYADLAARQIADSAMAYAPALSFWTDGATKRRWISLPGPIDTHDPDDWLFPVGTKAWKE